MHTNNQGNSVCKPHVLKRPAHSQRLQSTPEQIRILLVLRMNDRNILSCSSYMNQSRCLQSPCDAKLKSTTSVQFDPQSTNKTHWTHWTRSKDTKVDTKMTEITKVWKKDEVSAVSQLSPHHPRRGHTHGVRASPDRHSLHLTWLDRDILCVFGRSMAWTAAKRKMAVQTKVSRPSTVKHGIKGFFQTKTF